MVPQRKLGFEFESLVGAFHTDNWFSTFWYTDLIKRSITLAKKDFA